MDLQRREETVSRVTGLKRAEAIAIVVAGLVIALIAGIAVTLIFWASDRPLWTRSTEASPAATSPRTASEAAARFDTAEGNRSESRARGSMSAGIDRATVGADVRRINVSFKLDPRLTSGLFMGERWVSPPTYMRMQDANRLVVEARTQSVDREGRPVKVAAVWTSDDPRIAAVSPRRADEVEIQVYRPGTTYLTVASGATTKKMKLEAVAQAGHLRVAISQ
jgi:hypothetical protein